MPERAQMTPESRDAEAPPAAAMAEAMRKARLAEAAHFDANADIRDAKTLRLHVLMDEVLPSLAVHARGDAAFIDPVIVPGEPPRLWVDMVAYVVMEPDPRTFRFQRDSATGREILLETRDRAEMRQNIITYAAHRLVERERQFASDSRARPWTGRRYGATALFLTWLAGFSTGALALLALGVWLAKTSF